MKFPDGVVIWSSILPEIYFLHLYKELQVHCSVSYAYGKLITFTAGDKMRLNLWEMFQKNLIRKNPLVPFLLNTLFRLLCSSYTVNVCPSSTHPFVRPSVRQHPPILHKLSSSRKSWNTHSGVSIFYLHLSFLFVFLLKLYKDNWIRSFSLYSEIVFSISEDATLFKICLLVCPTPLLPWRNNSIMIFFFKINLIART